ncbi:MAG: TetR/AcrR family transcriptional regulator [Desulfarculaceae bacterium]|nr:TetR/AcrR family transcriptional regulator [Desulfarculaceae bacterium]MCF8049521.1 TetR/AcrR family transcriptional regulator [Desulfarculaceae bacterium]
MSSSKPAKKVQTRIKDHELIDQRRRQIAEGAMKVFVAKGYHMATVREIAEAAGMTMGSMYNYVRSKEDIIFFVYEHITHNLRDEMTRAIEGITDPKERLRAALRHNLEAVEKYSDAIMFMYQSSGCLDRDSMHVVLGRETEYIEMFEELLRQSLGDQDYDEFRLRLAADILAYLPVIITLRRWSLNRRFKATEDVMEGIMQFILHGLDFFSHLTRVSGEGIPGTEEQ